MMVVFPMELLMLALHGSERSLSGSVCAGFFRRTPSSSESRIAAALRYSVGEGRGQLACFCGEIMR